MTAMSTVEELDMAEFLPIYYNSSRHANFDPPSTVLCYDTGRPGYWCFRPVDNVPVNKEVVTIYSSEWKVRETLTLVRKEDMSLQEELENIGFHILQSNQRDFNPKQGAVVMGRHELTHSSKASTKVVGVEFRDGFLCKKESAATVANPPVDAGGEVDGSTPLGCHASPGPWLDAVPLVTNATSDTPTRKKPKSEKHSEDSEG